MRCAGPCAVGREHEPPAVVLQRAHVVDGARDLAAVPLDLARTDDQRLDAVGSRTGASASSSSGTRVEREARQRPPAQRRAPPRARAPPRTIANDAADRSSGVAAPAAADVHAASRNSCVVATRSCARRRTRSGSTSDEQRVVGHEVEHGDHAVDERGREGLHALDRDALGELVEHVERARELLDAARRRARAPSSVSRISRHGGAHSPCSATSRLRWSATENQRISSTSSPHSSMRSGWSSVGGNTSRIPPRTANSPRRSTMSTRV